MYRSTSKSIDFGVSVLDLLIVSRIQRKLSPPLVYERTAHTHHLTPRAQLFAEPSLILYIRTKFDLSNVVIVSPDAGGAKRCVR